jgi:hypothetical protein
MTSNSNVNPFAREDAMTTCRYWSWNTDPYYGGERDMCRWLFFNKVPNWPVPQSALAMPARPSSCASCGQHTNPIPGDARRGTDGALYVWIGDRWHDTREPEPVFMVEEKT